MDIDITKRVEELSRLDKREIPPRPPKKVVKIVNTEVPELKDYSKPAPESFWHNFPSKKNWRAGTPFKLNVKVLWEWVVRAGASVGLVDLYNKVVGDIEKGADLKVGKDYVSRTSKNATSATGNVWGRAVTDSIATGIKGDIFAGPYKESELPHKKPTVNSLQVAPKPCGKPRIILNMSDPPGQGVNAYIRKDEYPALMGGMKEILVALNYVGRGAKFFKCDWNQAYKHIGVRPGQLKYQYFKWLGRYFIELCLVFGNVSSVGIYDRLARLMWLIAASIVGYQHFLVVQHLDDLCAIGSGKDGKLEELYRVYWEVCTSVGVSLQEPKEAKEDKAFGPTDNGSMLGINFDTVTWKWWISEEKVIRYTNDLSDIKNSSVVKQSQIWSSVGKVLYVASLVPESRYYTSELIRVNNLSDDPNANVLVTKKLKKQLEFWILLIKLVGEGMPIPQAETVCPPHAWQADSDAAGGSLSGNPGCGIVFGNAWAELRWPAYVNSDETCACGSKFKHKLTMLELVGHLLHVTAFPEEVRGRVIRTNIDNSGTVYVAAKGRSNRCQLTDCLLKAINYVAVALSARAFVVKVARCSTVKADAADALSKGDMARFRRLVPDAEEEPRPIPGTVLVWLDNPYPDWELGKKIVLEMKACGIDVLVWLT